MAMFMPGDLDSLLPQLEGLMVAEDPEEQPYKSKYQARSMLEAWRAVATATKEGGEEERREEERARVAYLLGKIALETEESHEADKELSSALAWFMPGLGETVDKMGSSENEPQQAPPPQIITEPPPYQPNAKLLQSEKRVSLAEDCLDLLNNLGILFSGRGYHSRALLYLLVAKDFYNTISPMVPSNSSTGQSDQLEGLAWGAARLLVGCQDDEAELASPTDLTCQVYGSLGAADLSGFYCHQTLKRQLEDQVFLDSYEWVKNCLSLVDYFTNVKNDLQAAQHCLNACTTLLQQRPPKRVDEESTLELKGEITRRWGTLYSTILSLAFEKKMMESLQEEEDDASISSKASKPSHGGGSSNDQSTTSSDAAAIRFDSLQFEEVLLPIPEDVKTFDQAREVFLKASKYLEEARKVFVLDGFVTEHCHLTREISRLYRFLAAFEADEKRRLAMYVRRANALQPLVDQINPKAFEDLQLTGERDNGYLHDMMCTGLHKQMSFELGEIYMEMLECKLGRIQEKIEAEPAYQPKKAEVEKCNEFCSKAIAAFEHFTEMYQVADDQDAKKKVWKLEKAHDLSRNNNGWQDDVRPVLRAFFHLARLRGRMNLFGTMEERVRAARLSLETHEWLLSFAPQQLNHFYGDTAIFDAELKVSRDMTGVLPDKINRMHYQHKSFSPL